MISPAAFAGGGFGGDPLGAGVLASDQVGVDADVRGGDRVERLLLRAHDRLQRGVAGLVDRVSDGDHRGQLDLDGVIAVLGLTLAAQRLLLDVHLDHLRQRGHAEMLGHDRADRVALAVVGLLAQQHEIGALALERLGERVAGGGHVRAGELGVGQVHGAVRAERDCLVQSAHCAVGAHRHRDDLLDRHAAALSDLHRRLDRVRVVRVEVLLAAAVHAPRRRVDPLLDGGVWNLLHQDAYLHLLGYSLGGGHEEA